MTGFIEIEGRTLTKALKTVTSIMEKRNSIPILSNVRLQVKGNSLVISGTDLDVEIEASVDLIAREGKFDITVPGIMLYAIARPAGPAIIRIEPATREIKGRTVIKGTRAEYEDCVTNKETVFISVAADDAIYELDTLPPSDYPEMFVNTDLSKEKLLQPRASFTNGRLVDLLKRILPAISTEETRYYLNGIFYQPGRLTATDGHRLVSVHYDKEETGEYAVIIPRKVCRFLANEASKDCQLWTAEGGGFGRAILPGLKVTFKLIDGTYPDYARVIPKGEQAFTFSFDAARVRQAVERVTPISTERGRAIKLNHAEDGTAVLSVSNPDYGTAKAKTFAPWPKDAPEIGFNHRYFLEFLPKGGKVRLKGMDSGSPYLIEHDAEPDTIRVLMPMRV